MDDNSVTNTHDQKLPSTRRKVEEDVSIEYLREAFRYEPETGLLFWSERPLKHFKNASAWINWNNAWSGRQAGSANSSGYLQVHLTVSGWSYRFVAHRVIWALQTGAWPTQRLDHIDHDRMNNRWSNLRDISFEENARNVSTRSNNRSGVTGVFQDKRTGEWQAQIRDGERVRSLGTFATKAEAIFARKVAEVELGYHPNHGLDLKNGEKPMFPVRLTMNTDDYQLIVEDTD